MIEQNFLHRYLARFRWAAVSIYVTLVVLFAFISWKAIAEIFEHHAAVAATNNLLEQLQGRRPHPAPADGETVVTGSPFIEGQTLTVAGAALLQRVSTAVTRVGGNMLSSQEDLHGTQAKPGYVGVIANFELSQPALQQLLYDLEAGMPFLFVDQLVVQTPSASASGPQEGRFRVLLEVSGQWQGAK